MTTPFDEVLPADRVLVAGTDDYHHDEALGPAPQAPIAVLLPTSAAEVAAILRVCDEHGYFWLEDPYADGGVSTFSHRRLKQFVNAGKFLELVRNHMNRTDFLTQRTWIGVFRRSSAGRSRTLPLSSRWKR